MATTDATRADLIPSYVRDRNEAAARAGLEVSVVVVDGGYIDQRVRSTWLGTKAQFLAAGMRLEGARWEIKRAGGVWSPFVHGSLVREGEDIFSLAMGDRPPARQFLWRGISVLEFEPWTRQRTSETTYYAAPEVLVNAGVMTPNQAPRGRGKRPKWRKAGLVGDEYFWDCTCCFNGKVCFQKQVISDELRQTWARNAVAATAASDEAERQEKRIERQLEARTIAAAKQDDAFQVFMRRLAPGEGRR